MSPRAVAARLLEANRLSAGAPPGAGRVDMSPAGVGARLREVAQLYALHQHLRAFSPGPTSRR